ncbi:MAG: response regulator with CheY-like receiver domain and winged-helix DNA-binding domain [Verrucomicrobiales bacterium]|nr:response regulator with CheY-like receiver domain and winged-helix DNA-binding domain [Verrucomicrobiales bacterium]
MSDTATITATLPKFILFAEDDLTDVYFCEEGIKKFDVPVVLKFVGDGAQAIDWLSGEGPYGDRRSFPMPDLFITDLKMPRRDGLDVLKWVRSRPDLTDLAVVICSTSYHFSDLTRAQELGAIKYIVKDARCASLMKFLREYLTAA